MNAKQVAEYLTELRLKSGLTYETVAEKSKRSESNVKNLCSGKTEDLVWIQSHPSSMQWAAQLMRCLTRQKQR